MSNYIVAQFGALVPGSYTLKSVNVGDPYLYFDINSTTTLVPQQEIRFLVAPSGAFSESVLSGYLENSDYTGNSTDGLYCTKIKNDDMSNINFPGVRLQLDTSWENTPFYLYWMEKLGDDFTFDGTSSGFWSFPHNIQPDEVTLSGQLDPAGTGVLYNISFNSIINETTNSYLLNVAYITRRSGTDLVPNWSSEKYYSTNSIDFTLPLYDPRDTATKVPCKYTLYLNNVGGGPVALGSRALSISLDHSQFALGGSFSKGLDAIVGVNDIVITQENRGDEIKIDPYIASRKRVSVRIEDIAIKKNSYVKKGSFVSNIVTVDDPIYTFSLKVNEYIPKITPFYSYDFVKYYVEFNGLNWVRISPLGRTTEYVDENVIPKLLIFDLVPTDITSEQAISYLPYTSRINTFRLKIEFDLSGVSDELFIPPEISQFECIIFDKNRFLDI